MKLQDKQNELALLAARFLTFDRWLGAAPVGAGNINETWRIDVTQSGEQRSFLLQQLNTAVFRAPEAVAENIAAVAEHLIRSGRYPLKTPAPVPTHEGQGMYTTDKGDCWRVFPFFHDTFAPEQLPDVEQAYEAARAYGAFLNALSDMPADRVRETIPGFHDTDRRWERFEQVLEEDPVGRVKHVYAEINAMFEAKPVFDQISQLKRSGALPLRVTHNDTKAGNVLLDTHTNKAVAVIDWDTIMPGVVLSDFGDMVRTFVPDRYEDDPDAEGMTIRRPVLDALYEGFLSETAAFLTKDERDNLALGAQWIVGEQALRFLADYIAGDVYYKVKSPEHNLIRAANQLALLKRLQ